MNIFATNDDGEECEGIRVLARELRKAGHRVLVVAPDRNRSGASNSLSFGQDMQLKNVAEDTWTAAGTPVDCVLIGLLPGGLASDLRLGFKADAVISGINAGANMGTDILYSGTAAAARQGSHFGIPSIALSLDGSPPFSFEEPAKWAVSHLNELLALWDSEVFVNVNFPQKEGLPEGIVMTFPSRRVYDDAMDVKDVDGGKIARLLDGGVGSHPQEGSDACEVGQGNISVTRVNNLPVAR